MFGEILPKLSFGDNVRPSQVTRALRERLITRQKRARQSATVVVVVIVLLFNSGLTIVALNSLGAVPWRSVFLWEGAGLAATVLAIWSWHSRLTAFLQEAPVAVAAVLESTVTTLWGIGGLPSWMRGSARSLGETLEDDEEGTSDEVIRIAKIRLRFRPGFATEQLTWDDLRDELPHVDATKWLFSGGWGTFAYGLKRGSLLSLLYAPESPAHCRIVQRIHSTERRVGELQ